MSGKELATLVDISNIQGFPAAPGGFVYRLEMIVSGPYQGEGVRLVMDGGREGGSWAEDVMAYDPIEREWVPSVKPRHIKKAACKILKRQAKMAEAHRKARERREAARSALG